MILMNARHDASYKHLFSSPKVVRHLVEGFIPDEEIKRLDFSTLERMNASYVSEDLRERADDVVWRVRTEEDWLYLYFLIEFQSGENAYSDEALAGLKNVVAATIRLERQQSPRDLARFIEALHRWFADDAELERILSVWIREYLLRDLRPELNVPEAHDLGQNHHATGRTIQAVGTRGQDRRSARRSARR